jgi:hypothetical protein
MKAHCRDCRNSADTILCSLCACGLLLRHHCVLPPPFVHDRELRLLVRWAEVAPLFLFNIYCVVFCFVYSIQLLSRLHLIISVARLPLLVLILSLDCFHLSLRVFF